MARRIHARGSACDAATRAQRPRSRDRRRQSVRCTTRRVGRLHWPACLYLCFLYLQLWDFPMIRRSLSALCALAVTVAFALPLAAQERGAVGTIIIAHGGDSTWNSGVAEVAGQVRTGGPVEV